MECTTWLWYHVDMRRSVAVVLTILMQNPGTCPVCHTAISMIINL